MTGRAESVALALVLQVLPQTLIGPTAGVVNDRLRRKRVMIAADIGRMAIVFCMLLVRSRATVGLVYPLLVAETLLAAFFEPARNAVIPNIVAQKDVVLANTLSSSTWSVNLMVGATAGGFVAAFLGRDAVFVLNALSFLMSAVLILGMHFAEPHVEGARPFHVRELVDFSPIVAGIRYVRSHARLRSTVLVKAGNLIIGVGWVLFTVMGQREFRVRWHGLDPARGAFLGMSLLLGARGLGALLGPLYVAPWAGSRIDRLERAILGQHSGHRSRLCAPGSRRPPLGRPAYASCSRTLEARLSGSSPPRCCSCRAMTSIAAAFFSADLGLAMLTIAAGAYAPDDLSTGALPPATWPARPAS